MSKGKEHKKYEFGAKASVVVGKNSGVILGAYSLPKNDYDGHALEPTLAQVERVSGYRPAVAIGDKGFRGKTHCGTTEIVTPNRPKKNATAYEKRKAKARFRRRAAIEPRIPRSVETLEDLGHMASALIPLSATRRTRIKLIKTLFESVDRSATTTQTLPSLLY
jgi:IS5 family transposase